MEPPAVQHEVELGRGRPGGATSQPEPEAKAESPGALRGAVDTHCHLFLMQSEPGGVVSEARSLGVETLICVGIDPDTSRRSLELAESFKGVFATAGVHPHAASSFDLGAGSAVEELLGDPLVVGVGETGLDYYRRLSPVEDQRRAFRTHVALSRETGKPLVVHVRDAWHDALEILGDEGAEGVVLHCFTGDGAAAAEAGARGYFLSFAGNLTYPRAEAMRGAAGSVEEGRLLAETDSPFLPPQDRRGQENHPANVLAVARELASCRGLTLQQTIEATARNARSAFPLGP